MSFIVPKKAMILAAGRGERMRPLTDSCPKPLLKVGDKSLIEYHIEALVAAGFKQLIVNHAYLGSQIVNALGDGSKWGCEITLSKEPEGALETGGAVFNVLDQFGDEPFLVVNGDIWTDYDYSQIEILANDLAHLVLIDNPAHNVKGDFVLTNQRVDNQGLGCLTFSGIGIYHPALFADCVAGSFPLAPLLRQAIEKGQVSGEYYTGQWWDIGTPERLALLDDQLLGRVG